MKTVALVAIYGDLKMDQFMHASDVFETFKAFATVNTMTVEVDDEVSPVEVLQRVKSAFDNYKQYRLVALFIPMVSDGSYLDETVKVISDGQKWVMLDKALAAYNYVKPQKIIEGVPC